MDTGLRRRRHSRSPASTSSFCHRERDPAERLCRAWKSNHLDRYGDERHRSKRELDREWHCRRKFEPRNHFIRWRLYRAYGSAFVHYGANHGHKPRRSHKIRLCQCNGHERHHVVANAESGKCGTWRDAAVWSERNEQRSSQFRRPLEFVGRYLPQRVRERGLRGHVHRPANSSITCKRHAYCAKRG